MKFGIWRSLLALLALGLLAGTPAHAEWLRAESPNFVMHSEGSEETLRARIEQLEEFDRLLRMLTGTTAQPSPNKLHLYFVRSYGQLSQVYPVSQGIGGFYSASPDGIVAVIDHSWRQDYMTHEEVLLHEYAHHFMLQYFPAAYPTWYLEGFAEYVATTRLTGDSIEFGRFNEARASWLADRSGWLPLDRLLFSDPGELRGREVSKFYAQSWLLVHYLLRDAERRRQLSRYLVAVGQGQDSRRAFTTAFGTSSSDLQRAISRYAGEDMSYSRLPRITAAEAPRVTVTRLDSVPDELVLAQAAVRLTRTKDADRFLRHVRGVARGRSDPLAQRVLARAEALYGDGDTADRLIDPLLAAAPRDAELLYLKGMRHLSAGRRDAANRAAHFRQAQSWFVRAHRVDENHFPTLYRYAESLSLEPNFLSENTTNVLLLANQLAPQVREIALSTANVLMRRGEFAQAETLLTGIASDRHGGALATTARALLAKARARDNRELPDPWVMPEEEDD